VDEIPFQMVYIKQIYTGFKGGFSHRQYGCIFLIEEELVSMPGRGKMQEKRKKFLEKERKEKNEISILPRSHRNSNNQKGRISLFIVAISVGEKRDPKSLTPFFDPCMLGVDQVVKYFVVPLVVFPKENPPDDLVPESPMVSRRFINLCREIFENENPPTSSASSSFIRCSSLSLSRANHFLSQLTHPIFC
jgi:hypothetical protein